MEGCRKICVSYMKAMCPSRSCRLWSDAFVSLIVNFVAIVNYPYIVLKRRKLC